MTTLILKKIGLVAHYSEKGKWAFDLAFYLAKLHGLHLNIFQFSVSPYEMPIDMPPQNIPKNSMEEKALVDMDRKLREYYDQYLEEYEEVGFRVCENTRHNFELRQCLREKEYQLLIIPFIKDKANFGNMTIEEFAYRFNAPVILVGPDRPDQYHLNPAAKLLIDSLNLTLQKLKIIKKTQDFQPTIIKRPENFQNSTVL